MKSLCKKFDDFNAKAIESGQVVDLDSLKKYIDNNLEDVKKMIAPALPIPQVVKVSKQAFGVRKKLELVYICEITKHELVITQHEWNKWLKACATLVAAGYCVVVGDVVGGAQQGMASVRNVREAYAAYQVVAIFQCAGLDQSVQWSVW